MPGKPKTLLAQIKRGIKVTESVKDNMSKYNKTHAAKHTAIGKAIIDTHPDLEMKDFDLQKYILVKRLFVEWLNSRTVGETYTLLEIKNLLKILKMDFATKLSNKIKAGKPLDELDMKRIQQMIDGYVDLHKLQHGEKKVIQKMDFKFVRDLT